MKIRRSFALHLVVAVLLLGTLAVLYVLGSIASERAMEIGKKSLIIIGVIFITMSTVKILMGIGKKKRK